MKVEIVQSDSISELDKLINACIQDRKVEDIKLSTVMINHEKVLYTALVMLDLNERYYV